MIDERLYICDLCSNLVPFVVWCPKTHRMYCGECVKKMGREPPYTRFELWRRRIKELMRPLGSGERTCGDSVKEKQTKGNGEPLKNE